MIDRDEISVNRGLYCNHAEVKNFIKFLSREILADFFNRKLRASIVKLEKMSLSLFIFVTSLK